MNTDCLPMRNSDLRAREAARQEKPAHRAGFTLIEMLVVVIIISILAGMVLGLFKIAGVWAAKSQTNERLGKVRAAIEEFHAEYGKYPPVDASRYGTQPFYYEYPFSNGFNQVAWQNVSSSGSVIPGTSWDRYPIYTFGLMSFLLHRYAEHAENISASPWAELLNLNQWRDFNQYRTGDPQRDTDAINYRWEAHIEGVFHSAWRAHPVPDQLPSTYTNIIITVYDGWGHELRYESPPPYTRYKLYSVGPDGVAGTADDVSTGAGD